MQLRITHDTSCHYDSPAQHARHLAHLLPPATALQGVRHSSLHISPAPLARQDDQDSFGNWRTYFEIGQPHTCLHVRASSLVHTRPPPPTPDGGQPWEQLRQAMAYQAGAPAHPAALWAYPSAHIHPSPAFADYARPCFSPGRPLLQAARALMQRLHQDFAHVMLSCLRSLGLPARYVSGYLLTHPPPGQPRLIGSDASHAWVALYIPELAAANGQAWYELDPTNCRSGWGSPGADYVRLAVGRDFADISPLRGIIQGRGSQRLQVGVTVEPLDQNTDQP